MPDYRHELPELPPKMRHLPLSSKGYPIPYFVGYVDGEPDFRVADPEKLRRCVRDQRCWLCGGQLGRHKAFVIGPMCIVNRISAEPPSHLECARYATQACPFLVRPRARRREANLPVNASAPAGEAVMRNPGVIAVWVTTGWELMRAPGGFLFRIDDPHAVEWYAEGRPAHADEVRESFESGVELLRDMAQLQGGTGNAVLEREVNGARRYLPECC
jgi:hypothetical protein